MTNAEAIEILKHLRDDLDLQSKEYIDCFDMAISALEKQEPKPAPEPDDEVIQPPVCDPGEPEPEENGTVETEPEPRPAPEPKAPTVSTVVRAFRVDITGPLDAVLRRLDVFAALVGNLDVRITLSIDEGDAS